MRYCVNNLVLSDGTARSAPGHSACTEGTEVVTSLSEDLADVDDSESNESGLGVGSGSVAVSACVCASSPALSGCVIALAVFADSKDCISRNTKGKYTAELRNGESNDTLRPKGCSRPATSNGDCDGESEGVLRLREDGVRPLEVRGEAGAPNQPMTLLNVSPGLAGVEGGSIDVVVVVTIGRGMSAPVTLCE